MFDLFFVSLCAFFARVKMGVHELSNLNDCNDYFWGSQIKQIKQIATITC